MRPGGPALTALRAATADLHAETDEALRSGQWLATPQTYAGLLRGQLAFHLAVERAVAAHLPAVRGPGYVPRPRSPLLRADLEAVLAGGTDVGGALPVAMPAAFELTGPTAALGCLYVVEGSALGGRVLARWVERELGFLPGSGASGFAPYGGQTQRVWAAFVVHVESWCAAVPGGTQDPVPELVAGAVAAYGLHRAVVGPVLASQAGHRVRALA